MYASISSDVAASLSEATITLATATAQPSGSYKASGASSTTTTMPITAIFTGLVGLLAFFTGLAIM